MWTTADDVRTRWIGDPLDITDAALAVLIQDAEDVITSAVPNVADLVAAGTVPIERVKRIVARMVIRVLRNPTGIRTIQETTGQFSGSTTYAGDSLGEIVFTDEDRRDLLGPGSRARKAFSFMPGGVR